jgi:hypothetical protein
VLDGALQVISGATQMIAIAGQPADYAAAVAAKLADVAMVAGDFSMAPGDVSGRKVLVAPKPGASVVAAGTADHVALLDTAGARLLYVTTCPPQALPMGGIVNFAGWAVEIGAPV